MNSKERIIKKRKSNGHYYALRGSYKSDDAYIVADVKKERIGGKSLWRVYLVNAAPAANPEPTLWRSYETLNAAFDNLNATIL